MATLPSPRELERICKGIATLDAILCEEWEFRYYSFNAAWSRDRNERMASMRNGSGDDWVLVFGDAGAFIKALWHEYPREDVAAIYAGIPASLEANVHEPAFAMDAVTFGGFHDGTAWTLRGNPAPLADQLAILGGDSDAYRAFALDYFEAEVALDAIEHVLAGKPLTDDVIARIAPHRTLDELAAELAEIGYGA